MRRPTTRKGADVARKRPTASDVEDHGFAGNPQLATSLVGPRPTAKLEEIAEIVLRAGRLGFCRSRVATALGVSPDELAKIEQRNM